MSRPRIVYVLGSLAANDVGEEVVAILGRLSRAQFDPRVITLGGRDDLRERVRELKVRAYGLELAGPLGTWRAVGKVQRLLAAIEADVLHGYGSWGGAVAQLAAPRDVAVVRSVRRAPTRERDMRGRVLRALERRAARQRADTYFIVPDEAGIELARRAYGARSDHVSVLPTSVDVAAIRDRARRITRSGGRRLMGIRDEETAFALITDFASAATMDRILTGLSLASQEKPGMRLFIVGSGPHEGATRWKAEELRLGDSVVFLGRGTEAGPIWASADFAIDATSVDGWSRKGILAIAAGLPTVKLRADDVVRDDGIPTVPAQAERFAAAVVRTSSDPSRRQAVLDYGAGVTRAMDVGNVVERLADLYRTVASSGP